MVAEKSTLQFDTFEAFHDWALRNEARAEWVAGKTLFFSDEEGYSHVSVSRLHQKLQLFLARLLVAWLEEQSLGGEVLGPEFAVRLPTRPSGREPDVLYVSAVQMPQLRNTFLDGPAALCVEIVSPESADRDFNDKFQEYEAAGVEEYWILDPDDHAIFFYRLAENGRYRRILPQDGVFVSQAVPNLPIQPAWLWQDPLPTLREIGRFWDARGEA
jgi:Uma2 family endonuclease